MSATPPLTHAGAIREIMRPKLPARSRIAYGLGDFASQLVWSTTTSYLAIFYTDQVGLAAGVVALLLLIARVLDGVIDPFIGALAERTRSRYGRFRPWILYGAVPLGVMMVLTFSAPFSGGTLSAALWATFTYGVLGIIYSCVNVPYGALAGVMTESPVERVALTSSRMIGTNVAAIVLALVTVPVIVFFSGADDGQTQTTTGYTWTAVLLAVVAVALFFFLFGAAREVVVPARIERVTFKDTIKAVATNRPLLLVFIGIMLLLTSFFGRLGVVVYYGLYNLGDASLIPLLMSAPSIAAVISISLLPRLGRRFSKRALLIASLVGQGVTLLALYLAGWGNLPLVIVISFLYGLMSYGTAVVLSMVPDTVDYQEDRTGVRTDGSAYATISLSTKIASAVGGSAGIALIGAFGYIAGAEQSGEALGGINLVVNLLPALLALLALIPFLFYRITDKGIAEARARLDERRLEATGAGTEQGE